MTAGLRFGRYRVDRRLGSGAFATVWLAHDDVLHAQVAVKLLADNWAHHLDVRERFLEEARILRRADSDRVVRVHDIGELDDGRPYFVMTYADRGSLADLAAAGPVPPAAVARYVAEAARGVAVLHGMGIAHRDLTPSNLLLRSSGAEERVLVADLGLAKALARASGLTRVAGTPGYAAPEQAAGDHFDERADVYALGAIAWRLATGQLPAAVAPGGVPLPPLERVPAALAGAVSRALRPEPAGRWPSAQAFGAALDAAATEPETAPAGAGQQVRPGAGGERPTLPPAAPGSGMPGSGMPGPGMPGSAAPPAPQLTPRFPLAEPTRAGPAVAPAADDATDPARPADSSAEAPARPARPVRPGRRRARRVVLLGVVALLAAAAGVFGWWRFAAPVTVRDVTGTVRVTVPAAWSGEARGDAWPLDRYGLPGRSGAGVSVAPDLSGWADTGAEVPGVFVGASRALIAVPPNRLEAAATHQQCRRRDRRQYRDERLAGVVVRWSDCAGGRVTFDEAVLMPAAGGYLVVIQVKQVDGTDRTNEVLDSIRLDYAP